MLESIKLLLGITGNSKDGLLSLLIESAVEEAKAYTRNDDVEDLLPAIRSMVVFHYGRIGSEGLDSESYSGASYAYSADYPESIMRQLKAKRKVVMK